MTDERTSPEEPNASQSSSRASEPPQPESVEEALRQAMDHARNAMAEGLLAGRSLIDAGSIAIFGEPARLTPAAARSASDGRVAFAAMARGIDELAAKVRSTDGMSAANETMLRTMLDALDVEIGRWERRSAQDTDARAVLRAFLGLREILWEFGVRRADSDAPPSATSTAPPSATSAAPPSATSTTPPSATSTTLPSATPPPPPSATPPPPTMPWGDEAGQDSRAAANGPAEPLAPPRVQRVKVQG